MYVLYKLVTFIIISLVLFIFIQVKSLTKYIDILFQVIIDSQPLTVSILASFLFGETIGLVGIAGLILGVVGLALLEVY